MADNPQEEYLDFLNRVTEDPERNAMYQDALDKKIPAVRNTTAKFLDFLIRLKQPVHVLEIGTGSGLSTHWLLKSLSPKAQLITIERDKNRFSEAFNRFQTDSRVRLLYTDALDYLRTCKTQFDFIFLDAQKRDYPEYLPFLETNLVPGGILVTDNLWFNGKVLHPELEERKSVREGVELLKSFHETLSRHPGFDCIFLPFDDGIMAAVKK